MVRYVPYTCHESPAPVQGRESMSVRFRMKAAHTDLTLNSKIVEEVFTDFIAEETRRAGMRRAGTIVATVAGRVPARHAQLGDALD